MYAETEVIQAICLQCQAPDLYHDMTAQLPNAGHPMAPQGAHAGSCCIGPIQAQQSVASSRMSVIIIILTIPPVFMPNDYLPVTLVVVIILNSTSMAISLPADSAPPW